MRALLASLALFAVASGLWSGEAATPATSTPAAPTPDVLATGWVQALKRNDLSGAFALFTPADQASLANLWRRQMARPDAYADAQIDTLIRVAQNPTATDQLLAMAQPYLGQIDVPKLTKGIGDIAGFLGTAADSQPAGASSGLDYAGLRDWLKDLATWLPSAGLTDQTKAKAAAGHLVRAVGASGVKSAAELRSLPLSELVARLDPALPALKEALLVYDVQIDALLGSFTATLGDATSEHATIALGFTSLGKPRTVKLKLVQKNGAWQLAGGNDNPLTGLSQLMMMALLMQGMGGEAAQPPPKVTPVPEDDGAL
jgi:hypothetical protein